MPDIPTRTTHEDKPFILYEPTNDFSAVKEYGKRLAAERELAIWEVIEHARHRNTQ